VRLLLINQFIPPDPAPTARLLGEVAAELAQRGHEIVLIGDGADYRGAKTLFGSRALREVVSLMRLLGRSVLVRRVDVIVCLTSPPLVPIVARLAQWRHRKARLIHWAMDLYPEVAVALGEVKENSLLHRLTASLMGGVYRACDRLIVLDGDMAERVRLHGVDSEVLPPWPPAWEEGGVDSPIPAKTEDAFICLYSGNLGRAHEWRTLLDAQRTLEEAGLAIDLVFQGGGTERTAARDYASSLGLKRCYWRPYAEDSNLIPSLLAADCLIATQRPETSGCLWPSKLALALLLDRPLVWVGARNGAVGKLLSGKGHLCVEPGEAMELAEGIQSLRERSDKTGSGASPLLVRERIEGLRNSSIGQMADWIATPSR
jgi:colanic acid biosynthesis glycosyl transferase WcaI